MFSGIVQERGRVVDEVTSILRVRAKLFGRQERALGVGDSISVSGVCLTIRELSYDIATFDLATETRRKTILGGLRAGDNVNLEPGLRLGESLDGHLVLGHVDTVCEVLSVADEGENTKRVTLSLPEETARYIVQKGSVALDGVSLTVGEVSKNSFAVYLIPYTLSVTTLQDLHSGRRLNLEADCVARYLEKLALPYARAEDKPRRRLLW